MAKRKFKLANSTVFAIVLSLVLNVLAVFVMIYASRYSTIQTKYFMVAIAAIIGLTLIVNIMLLVGYGKRILWMRRVFVYLGVFSVLVTGVASYYLYRINSGFDKLVDVSPTEVVEYSMITLDQNLSSMTLDGTKKLGYVDADDTYNQKILGEVEKHSTTVKVVTYSSYSELLNAFLVNDEVDVVLVPKQFRRLAEGMSETYQAKLEKAVALTSFNISLDTQQNNVKVLEEPFTILMMGINENLADSIIVATVNPKTLTVTLTSIARDSYVPIACYAGQAKDKINHARGRSRQCFIDTVEDYMQIDVDFYFETDFYALVKIVDAIGGLEITSPISFGGSFPVENSNTYEDVFIEAGTHVMTGKQVLTFSRERHHFPAGDFDRQLNQQYVIKTLAYKIMEESKRNPNVLVDVLDAAKDNIVMSLSMENDIAPLLGYILSSVSSSPVDMMSTFTIKSVQLIGTTPTVNGVSYVTPYRASVEYVRSVMHENLELTPKTTTPEAFDFSINDPYKGFKFNRYEYAGTPVMYPVTSQSTAPETPSTETPDPEDETPTTPTVSITVPNFTKDHTLDEVLAWGKKNGVTITQNVIDESSPSYKDVYANGQIIYQSVDPGKYTKEIKTMTISIVKLNNTTPTNPDPGDGDGE